MHACSYLCILPLAPAWAAVQQLHGDLQYYSCSFTSLPSPHQTDLADLSVLYKVPVYLYLVNLAVSIYTYLYPSHAALILVSSAFICTGWCARPWAYHCRQSYTKYTIL